MLLLWLWVPENWITPAHELEKFFFPQPEWIVDAIHEKIMPLKGHIARTNFTENEQIRLNRLGSVTGKNAGGL
jgi:2-oxoisovalerate dehydrogenase E1 component